MSRDYRVVAEGLLVERASSVAVGALRRAGIRAILLKGPLQQWWLEAGGPPRASTDIDVLVRQEQLEAAGVALAGLGYSRAVGLPDEIGLEHSTTWVAIDRPPVEIHWSLVGADDDKLWDVLSNETELAAIGDEPVEIPNEAARCMIVALHAAQHGIGQQAIFADLEKAFALTDTETWRRASELAAAADGWTPFAGALSLTSNGRELLEELGAAPPVLGERQALSLLTPAPTSRGFYFLSRQSGSRAKAAFILAKLAPSPDFMRLRYPRVALGRTALAVAYLKRSLWLLRWALPGLRSWRRARHLARSTELSVDPNRLTHQLDTPISTTVEKPDGPA